MMGNTRRKGYEMNLADRERMEDLCKRISVEKDPLEIEKLALKLNDLISATLKSVQRKPEARMGRPVVR